MKNKKIFKYIVLLIFLLCCGTWFVPHYLESKSKQESLNAIQLSFVDNIKDIEYGSEIDVQTLIKEVSGGEIIELPQLDSKRIGNLSLIFTVQNADVEKQFELPITIIDSQAPIIEFVEDEVSVYVNDEFDPISNVKFVKDAIDGEIEYNHDQINDYPSVTKSMQKKNVLPSIAQNFSSPLTLLRIRKLHNTYLLETNLDMSKKGEYKVKIIAYDKNGLKTTKEYPVKVEEQDAISQLPSSINRNDVNQPNGKYQKKQHYINVNSIENIGLYTDSKHGYQMVQDIINNKNKWYYVPNQCVNGDLVGFGTCVNGDLVMGDSAAYLNSLINIFHSYTNISSDNNIQKNLKDDHGEYMMIKEDVFPLVRSQVINTLNRYDNFRAYIKSSLLQMNLNCDDFTMVNQINYWIVNHFSYKVTNDILPSFTETGVGQCYHYANLFKAMCTAVGIPATVISDNTSQGHHSWNSVTVYGKTYYFDPTWNDGRRGPTYYSWLSKSEMYNKHW